MKKVLIFSKKFDPSTCDVMDWIDYKGSTVQRINLDDNFYNCFLEIGDSMKLRIENMNKFSSVWFRKNTIPQIGIKEDLPSEIEKHLSEELLSLNLYTFHYLTSRKIRTLGFCNEGDFTRMNKLKVLLCAKKNKLNIPKTLVSTSKISLLKFKKKVGPIITKSISEFSYIRFNSKRTYGLYTDVVEEEFLSKYNPTIFPTLIQEKLEKDIEIRIFFIKKRIWSCAIFTQNTEKTVVDMRIYDFVKPNRVVPYNLPNPIKHKLMDMMTDLKLDSGSIDMIKTKSGKYYFIEVNPAGQFGHYSKICNFHIEKEIANYLLNS